MILVFTVIPQLLICFSVEERKLTKQTRFDSVCIHFINVTRYYDYILIDLYILCILRNAYLSNFESINFHPRNVISWKVSRINSALYGLVQINIISPYYGHTISILRLCFVCTCANKHNITIL